MCAADALHQHWNTERFTDVATPPHPNAASTSAAPAQPSK
jgi:hypothetical protein